MSIRINQTSLVWVFGEGRNHGPQLDPIAVESQPRGGGELGIRRVWGKPGSIGWRGTHEGGQAPSVGGASDDRAPFPKSWNHD